METSGTLAGEKPLWQLPNWRRFWGATSISALGDIIFDITALLWISTVLTKGTTWGPMAVSGLVMCSIIPILLFGTIGGALADRFSPRKAMVTCNLLQGVLIASVVPLAFIHQSLPLVAALAWVYAAVGFSNMAGVVFNAARMKMLSAAIPEPHWPQAASLLQGTSGVLAIVGPPLAAPLLFSVGPWLAFTLNATSFLVGSMLLAGITLTASAPAASDAQQTSLWEEIREGLSFVLHQPILRALIVSLFVVTLGTAPINSLQVFFVPENLNAAPQYIGFLSGSFGVGAMIGAFASAPIASRCGVAPMYVGVVVAVGVTLIGYSRTDSIFVGCAVLTVAGALVGSLNTALSPLLLGNTPQHMLGRVMGIMNPLQQGASLIAISVSGFVASALTVNFAATVGFLEFRRTDLIFGACGVLVLVAIAATGRPILTAAKKSAG